MWRCNAAVKMPECGEVIGETLRRTDVTSSWLEWNCAINLVLAPSELGGRRVA
jgi:hypothetical protein